MAEPIKSIRQIQKEHNQWREENFPLKSKPSTLGVQKRADQAYKGMVEEIGELTHSLLKEEQGIRLDEDHESKKKDALADLLIYAIDFAGAMEWDIHSVLADTWEEVRKRNWDKYPDSKGLPPVS